MTVYYRVERMNQRTGQWRRISPEGHGGLDGCLVRYRCELEKIKRGRIRIVGSDGTVVKEFATIDQHLARGCDSELSGA